MNAEFNWWLLIVGLVVGAGLVWFVLMDSRRRDVDIDAIERPREAAWLAAMLKQDGWVVPPAATERLLELHRAYLEAPPPDDVIEPSDPSGPATVDAGAAPPASPARRSRPKPAGDETGVADAPAQLARSGRAGSELADDDRGRLGAGPTDLSE